MFSSFAVKPPAFGSQSYSYSSLKTHFEENGLPFWVPGVCHQCSEVVSWKLFSIQMIFWWIWWGESGLPVLFLHHVGMEEIPGVTGKFGLGIQNEAGQRLTEFCQENALVIANTLFQYHKTLHMDITRWSILKSDWLYSLQPKMEKLYTVNKNRMGADCGSDHELLIAKFRFKLKKVGKTTRPFRYDLNQIPYSGSEK